MRESARKGYYRQINIRLGTRERDMKQSLFVVSAMLFAVGVIALVGSKIPLTNNNISLGWIGEMAGIFLIPVSIIGMIGAYLSNRKKVNTDVISK